MKRLLLLAGLLGCSQDLPDPQCPAVPRVKPPVKVLDCARYDDGHQVGSSLLVVVNKQVALAGDYTPPDLLPVPAAQSMDGRKNLLRIDALTAFEAFTTAGLLEAGVDLRARSTYRSFHDQCVTFDAKVQAHGLEHAERYSARPGRSQHQLGTTVDITAEVWDWALEPEMAVTWESAWLFAQAGRFGFALSYPAGEEAVTGYAFEPWHYRYIGVEAAAEYARSGLILERYLQACAAADPRFTCPEAVPFEVPINHHFVGGACATDADCADLGAAAVCLVEGHPEGYCTVPCTRGCPDRPGNNQLTFCRAEADGNAWCRSQCDAERLPGTGCRNDYACEVGRRPKAAGSARVCVPQGRRPDAITRG